MQYQRAKIIGGDLTGRLVWVRAQPPTSEGPYFEDFKTGRKIAPFPCFVTNIHKDGDWPAILQLVPTAIELLAEFSDKIQPQWFSEWLKESNTNAQA